MIRAYVTFLLASATLLTRGQELEWDAPIDVDVENGGTLRPRVALNGSGEPVVLWADGMNACLAAVGMGGAFMDPMMVSPAGLEVATSDWQGPGIACKGSTVWAVFKGLPEDARPCYLVGSTDGGHTWGDTMRVDPADGLLSRFPAVAVGSDSEPVVQYMQFDAGFSNARQVVRSMMDGMFMEPAQVSVPFAPGAVCDCCPGQVVSANEQVIALYRNAGGNIRTIWGAASNDGGMSFPTGEQVDGTSWFLGACPSSGPAGYITGDSVRYVWMSGEENGAKVYLGSAHASTLSIGSQRNVHPDQSASLQQNYPRIAGSGDTLGVVWEQSSDGSREIMFAWSVTGVTGLSDPDTVNVTLSGAQETPDIAFANGSFHIVWSEPATGQVRYRRAAISVSTAIQASEDAVGSLLTFDASSDALHWVGGQVRSLSVVDPSGKEVIHRASPSFPMFLKAMRPGMYRAKAVDTQARAHVVSFFIR